MPQPGTANPPDDRAPTFDPASIERPEPELLTYYTLCAACTLIGFPFVFIPYWFKYLTLRYKLDDEGVSMTCGLLFKKEVHLTYRRIQDIHVSRNLFHRWLGLSAISIQTASGSAGAEMVIEGVANPEALRDFLYTKMRGARGDHDDDPSTPPLDAPADETLALLHEIRDELRAARLALEARS
ncbi:MAG: PH domain-containing protein [Phycisphaerales bacterium]|nr:PH domain-containing protein [Phycisphaerales bacterium]